MIYPWLERLSAEFAERLRGGRMAHAMLLSGPAGLGKVELAREFLASLLCLEEAWPPCGTCRSCQLLRSGAHPEGHVLTFEQHPKKDGLRKELVVDQIRRLTAALQLTNTVSRRKAALAFPAESMNASAANALLKTLEEPPGDAVLILVSHNPSRLPATVQKKSPTRAAWAIGRTWKPSIIASSARVGSISVTWLKAPAEADSIT